MKRLNFSSLSLICFSLFSTNVYAQNNSIHAKDSVDIGTFSNCNNFIVHKENITVEGCPIGKGNSYVGEKGFGTYLGKFVGLNKRIELDNNNYQQQKIGGNTRYFSKISTSTPICYFKGKQFAHYDESTSEIHRLIKPHVSDVKFQNCHNSCDKYSDLLGKVGEREETFTCPNVPTLNYTKKIKTSIVYPNGYNQGSFKLDEYTNKWHFSAEHCAALNIKEDVIADNSAQKCIPPEPSITYASNMTNQICSLKMVQGKSTHCNQDMDMFIYWDGQFDKNGNYLGKSEHILDLWMETVVGFSHENLDSNIKLDVEDTRISSNPSGSSIGSADNITIEKFKNMHMGVNHFYVINYTARQEKIYHGIINMRKDGVLYQRIIFKGKVGNIGERSYDPYEENYIPKYQGIYSPIGDLVKHANGMVQFKPHSSLQIIQIENF